MIRNYQIAEQAIQWMHQGLTSPHALASKLGISVNHLQKVFSDWAGIPLGLYSRQLSKSRLRELLSSSDSVLDGALQLGLSGTGRLHDLTVVLEGASPGEIRSGGAGMDIQHGCGQSPWGPVWLAWSNRGVCELHFLECLTEQGEANRTETPAQRVAELRDLWPKASITEAPMQAQAWLDQAFEPFASDSSPLRLHVRGSAFQLKVWEALIRIPPGKIVSYGQLAKAVGAPGASRAVGTAVASNRLACLIPCHRVIQSAGEIGQYRWGRVKKQALLLKELPGLQSNTPLSKG